LGQRGKLDPDPAHRVGSCVGHPGIISADRIGAALQGCLPVITAGPQSEYQVQLAQLHGIVTVSARRRVPVTPTSTQRGAYLTAANGQAERSHSDTAWYRAPSSEARSALTQDRTSAPGSPEASG